MAWLGHAPDVEPWKHPNDIGRDVLCNKCHKNDRGAIAEEHTCERRDDPMRFRLA